MRSLNRAGIAATLLASFASAGQSPAPPTPTCATCHEKESRSQPQTPMAHGMWRPEEDPVFQGQQAYTFARDGYQWRVERHGADATYSVTDGQQTVTLPLRWILGDRNQTWVLEYKNRFYEGRLSYFASINGLDITPGDEKEHLLNIAEAVGREMHSRETEVCFGCHSTGAIVNDKLDMASAVPGVQCVHCHAGAEQHQQDIVHGKLGSIPPRLGKMVAEDISNFCGQCHRTWGDVVRRRAFGLADVRFGPYRLAKSQCYNGSDPRISCIACHNPHENLVKNDSAYESKCLACHAPAAKGAKSTGKVCPVSAASGCIGCHMPKTDFPATHEVWTDHYIRVVRPGEGYPD